MNCKAELLNTVQIMTNQKIKRYKTDKTFASVIKQVNTDDTYTIIDEDGTERVIYSSVPSLDLQTKTKVWVKIPCGNINHMHICGIRK